MVKSLVIAAVMWPAILGAAVWQRADEEPAWWPAAVYYAASHICHQRPERSFHTAGVAWPVCGRCTGLYLAAPLGALMAIGLAGGRSRRDWMRVGLLMAAVPTAVTLGLEWFDLASISNTTRFVSALPLGAAVAYAIVRAASGPQSMEYTLRR